MDRQEDRLFNSIDAAEYLGIPYDVFETFVCNGYICYLMRNLTLVFKESDLNRFKTEFLKR